MTDTARPDGRVVRGDDNDTLHAADPLLLEWLQRILKPDVFDGGHVVMPRDAMDGLVSMARDKGFVIDVQDD